VVWDQAAAAAADGKAEAAAVAAVGHLVLDLMNAGRAAQVVLGHEVWAAHQA
jgi:hypothetical protein